MKKPTERRCGAILCVPVGIVLLLTPANAFSITFSALGVIVVTAARSMVLFVAVWLMRSWIKLIQRGFYKYVIRGVVFYLFRVYIFLHPNITNAQLRKKKAAILQKTRETFQNMKGWHLFISFIGTVLATISLFSVLLWIGFMKVLNFLTQPIIDWFARTAVGKVLAGWWYAMTTVVSTYATDWYTSRRDAFRKKNMRALRRSARAYRKVHKTKNGKKETE